MDTWMGGNDDPITLHKYLYANVDPVNMVDPTGNFASLSGAIGAIGTAATLASVGITSFEVTSLLIEGGDSASASNIGKAVLLGLIGNKILKPIAKGCKFKKKAKRICNYALGWVGAQSKMETLVRSKKTNWLNRKRKNTVVGAFDILTGKSTADFNRGKDTNPPTPVHGSLRSLAKRSVGHLGCTDAASGIVIGNCAEFMAANKLMFGGAKRKAIRWTWAHNVNKSGTYGRRGSVKGYCRVCRTMFGLPGK